jgi:hypothetical protein
VFVSVVSLSLYLWLCTFQLSLFLSQSFPLVVSLFVNINIMLSSGAHETVRSFAQKPGVAKWLDFLQREKEVVNASKKVLENYPGGVVDLSQELLGNADFTAACQAMHKKLKNAASALFESTTIRATRVRLSSPTDAEIKTDGLPEPTKAMKTLWSDDEWKRAVKIYLESIQKALDTKFGKGKWTVTRFGEFGPHALRTTVLCEPQRAHLDAKRFFLSGLFLLY